MCNKMYYCAYILFKIDRHIHLPLRQRNKTKIKREKTNQLIKQNYSFVIPRISKKKSF